VNKSGKRRDHRKKDYYCLEVGGGNNSQGERTPKKKRVRRGKGYKIVEEIFLKGGSIWQGGFKIAERT